MRNAPKDSGIIFVPLLVALVGKVMESSEDTVF